MNAVKSSYNPTIGSVRGIMIILVMLGHMTIYSMWDDPFKWWLTGFRMPLFMAFSGYLLNIPRLRAKTPREVFHGYFERLILPWLFASAVYGWFAGDFEDLRGVASIFMHPYYHLWFIPAFLLCIAVAYFVRLPRAVVLIALAAIFVVAVAVFGLFDMFLLEPFSKLQRPLRLLGDSRYYMMPLFFFLGSLLRGNEQIASNRVLRVVLCAALIIGAAGWMQVFFVRHPAGALAAYLGMNLAVIVLFLGAIPAIRIEVPILEVIGRESFFFYLWHPAAFAIARYLIYPGLPHPTVMAVTMLTTLMVLYLLVAPLRRFVLTRRLLGLSKPHNKAGAREATHHTPEPAPQSSAAVTPRGLASAPDA